MPRCQQVLAILWLSSNVEISTGTTAVKSQLCSHYTVHARVSKSSCSWPSPRCCATKEANADTTTGSKEFKRPSPMSAIISCRRALQERFRLTSLGTSSPDAISRAFVNGIDASNITKFSQRKGALTCGAELNRKIRPSFTSANLPFSCFRP